MIVELVMHILGFPDQLDDVLGTLSLQVRDGAIPPALRNYSDALEERGNNRDLLSRQDILHKETCQIKCKS